MNNVGFQQFLQKNVVECYLIRRHEKPHWSDTRGAFITTSRPLLNSLSGLQSFGFKAPNGRGMGYNPIAKNCIVGWDIFKGEYRVFSFTEGARVMSSYPVNNKINQLKFWNYFADYVLKLTSQQKLKFMGYLGMM